MFGMTPVPALMLILGVYNGSVYGGSVSSILINTPGTPGSVATCFDGYPMAKKGKAGTALGISLCSSTIGGIFSTIAFLLFYEPLNNLFIAFGPSQLFLLILVAFLTITILAKESMIKGLIASGIGLLLGLVGYDLVSGSTRFTFGYLFIEDGLDLIAVLIGWFAITELMFLIQEKQATISGMDILRGSTWEGIKAVFRYPKEVFASASLGSLIGAITGVGIAVANLIAYSSAKGRSKHPEEFGEGSIEGLIAPETANNAVTSTSLIPTLALGIPGGASAAIILGALMMLGFRPGPGLYSANPGLIGALVVGLVVINIMMFISGLLMSKLYMKITQIKISVLVPVILTVSLLGCYLGRSRLTDIFFAIVLGIFAYGLRKAGYSLACVVLGFILAKMMEEYFFKSLLISEGGIRIFFQGTINIVLLSFAGLMLVWGPIKKLFKPDIPKQ
ncbi:MAG: tripartite tricarboxylate transporter permease, partial [Proteobacteria bacterium]|nr:tripartite tricarboxylate transporter permease [Pseudomonadota bacterium]